MEENIEIAPTAGAVRLSSIQDDLKTFVLLMSGISCTAANRVDRDARIRSLSSTSYRK